jgi:tetratricopeptide (TPR) repeat protein
MASGSLHHEARRFEKSEASFTEAANGYRARLGRDHEDTLLALSNQVGAMLTNGRYNDSAPLLEELCRQSSRKFGPKAPLVLTNQFNRAKLLHDQNHWRQAERLIKVVLEEDISLFGPCSLDVARDLELLGSIQCGAQRFVEGLRTYTRAQEILSEIIGAIHPRQAQLWSNIADAHFKLRAFGRAQRFLRKSCEISKTLEPRGSCELARYLKSLGFALFMAKNADPAVGHCFERSLALYTQYAGQNDERTLDVMDLLGNWCIGKSETLGQGKRQAALRARGEHLIAEAKRRATDY